ncbi:dephospho-CoA kinase [Treponema sp.]|uniref:dephospho-CoA kinase n=1 Tax=Treponema sp. TaxID=166 RepID=UPI0025EF4B50|nr:dephospho-CoA kinase [Treponema sp.]MCR5217937.1 dephospho-CoA kinase [Treponema sp.]
MNEDKKNTGLILCLTGPMAAGKNAAADILEKKGFISVDADQLGHKALESVSDKVIERFSQEAEKEGIQLTDSQGRIIRRNLGALLFKDKKLLQEHEKIIFPQINDLIENFAKENQGKNIIINATVLYKTDFIKKCRAILYIDCPLIKRLFRARKRDNMPFKQILQRFHSQKNLFAKYKKSNADIRRVRNTGTISDLEKKIDRFLTEFNMN